MLPLGWYAAYGSDGTEIIADLFKQCGIKVNSEFGGGYLAANIVAEAGETYLTMAKKVAKAINWQIRPNGLGEVSIVPYSNVVKARFDGENDVVEDSDDWWSFIDWNDDLNKQAPSQAVFIYTVKQAICIAKELGDNEKLIELEKRKDGGHGDENGRFGEGARARSFLFDRCVHKNLRSVGAET
jgi:hypothetical protein